MPIPLLAQGITDGFSSIPYAYPVFKTAAGLILLMLLKWYFGGSRNSAERLMRSKVIMVTGGTSGIGAAVVFELASRGAQIILLTQHPPSDLFLVDYIQDLRNSTKNQLIYAEQVDLSSLHSIRRFATKWVDNAPPRRLDMVILCADTFIPSRSRKLRTVDGLDEEWQVNYLSNFHLLSILSPALRAQPPDRDIRVIFSTCSGYIGARLDLQQTEGAEPFVPAKAMMSKTATGKMQRPKQPASKAPVNMYGMAKLSLMVFAQAFQKHLFSYQRPDKQPMNARVLIVDPGFSRTPGTRRWLTGGSLWGLIFYLLTWPLWWLVLKSPQQGAQSFLYAAMDSRFGRGPGGWMIKECKEVDFLRKEVRDDKIAKQLWEFSEQQIQTKEKESATKRALAKKEQGAAVATASATTTPSTQEGTAEPLQLGHTAKTQTPGSRRNRKTKA
jgi:hypothetical protein